MAYLSGGGWNASTSTIGNVVPTTKTTDFVINEFTSSVYGGVGIMTSGSAMMATVIGCYAGSRNIGSFNTFMGALSGQINQSGADNTFIGTSSGTSNVTGSQSTYVGSKSGNQTLSSGNTFIGYRAGEIAQGANNVYIGTATGSTTSAKYSTNNVVLGNSSYSAGNYGIVLGHQSRNTSAGQGILVGNNTTTSQQDAIVMGNNIANYGCNVFLVQTSIQPGDENKYVNTESDIININDKFIMGTGLSNSRIQLISDNLRFGSTDSFISLSPTTIQLNSSNLILNGHDTVTLSNASGWIDIGPSNLGIVATKELAFANGSSQFTMNDYGIALNTDCNIMLSNNLGIGMSATPDALQLFGFCNSITLHKDGDMSIASQSNVFIDGNNAVSITAQDNNYILLDHDGIALSTGTVGVFISESNVNIIGSTKFSDSILVDGIANFASNVDIQGPLAVVGSAEFSHTVLVDGIANFASNVDIQGTLTVAGSTEFYNTLLVDGIANFASNVDIQGPLAVVGSTEFYNTLLVDGTANFASNVDIQGTLTVAGSTEFYNTLLVDGIASFASNVFIDGTAEINGVVAFNSNVEIVGETVLGSNLLVYGDTNIQGSITCSSNLNVGGVVDGQGMSNFVLSLIDFSLATFSNQYGNGNGNGQILINGSIPRIEPCAAWKDSDFVEIETSLVVNSNLHVSGYACIGQMSVQSLNVDQMLVEGVGISNYVASMVNADYLSNLSAQTYSNYLLNLVDKTPQNVTFIGASITSNINLAMSDSNSVEVENSLIIQNHLYVGGTACIEKMQVSELLFGSNLILRGNCLFDNISSSADVRCVGSVIFGASNDWSQNTRYNTNSSNSDFIITSANGTEIIFQDSFVPGNLNFTGKHRCASDIINGEIGLIVIATGSYVDLYGNTEIQIDEAIPVVALSSVQKDKRVFGVIGGIDTEGVFSIGNMTFAGNAQIQKNKTIIQSCGEGGVWVSNINGNFENGDYITSSVIPGIGQFQEEIYNTNFTVGKITCDCNFDTTSSIYRCVEFLFNDIAYKKAFVGCSYCF
jgi:hypothetical protein